MQLLNNVTTITSPIQESTQLRQSERVRGALDELNAESTAQIRRFNAIQLSIYTKQFI